jgi:hypothetical protein
VTEDWEPLAPPQPPPDHPIRLRITVAAGPEVAVGTARTMRDVPPLLRTVADRWEAGCLIDEDDLDGQ